MTTKIKTVLVTGGQGFIGSHLVDLLLADPRYEVTVVDKKLSRYAEVDSDHTLISDFASPVVLNSVRNGDYDIVFHLAAEASVPLSVDMPEFTHEENVTKTLKLITACAESATKFIFSSSSSIYGNSNFGSYERVEAKPSSPYAAQKLSVENYCYAYNKMMQLDFMCLRYFNVYGPRQNPDGAYSNVISSWSGAVAKGKPLIVYGDGTQSRDFVYVGDVVAVNKKVAELDTSELNVEERALNVCTGKDYDLNYITKAFERICGPLSVIYKESRIGDVKRTLGEINKLKMIHTPSKSFSENLETTIDWYLNNTGTTQVKCETKS